MCSRIFVRASKTGELRRSLPDDGIEPAGPDTAVQADVAANRLSVLAPVRPVLPTAGGRPAIVPDARKLSALLAGGTALNVERRRRGEAAPAP